MRSFFVIALLVAAPTVSRACINDRDSDALAIQSKRLPDALRVISGRFERNPPRYYQMRAARIEGELKTRPRHFALYDDLAVAHDRLGDDETAMRVMARKRALLPTYNSGNKALKEAWYRYLANDGTFRAHRFLQGGAKVQNIAGMKRARAEIRRAIEIKPNAHFGRERVQLMVMDWIIACKQKKIGKTLGEWLETRDDWRVKFEWGTTASYTNRLVAQAATGGKGDSPAQIAAKETRRRETAEGLAGLVVLGAAWNSPDVFEALGHALEVENTIALRYLALLRYRELLKSGHKPFSGSGLSVARVDDAVEDENTAFVMEGVGVNRTNKETLDALYLELRRDADKWNTRRAGWMEAKFERGQHPDTNADFWQSFPETAPPSLDVTWVDKRAELANRRATTTRTLGVWAAILLFSSVVGGTILKVKRRREQTWSA